MDTANYAAIHRGEKGRCSLQSVIAGGGSRLFLAKAGMAWGGGLEEHLFDRPTLAPRTARLWYQNAPQLLEQDTTVTTWLTEAPPQPRWAAGWC